MSKTALLRGPIPAYQATGTVRLGRFKKKILSITIYKSILLGWDDLKKRNPFKTIIILDKAWTINNNVFLKLFINM